MDVTGTVPAAHRRARPPLAARPSRSWYVTGSRRIAPVLAGLLLAAGTGVVLVRGDATETVSGALRALGGAHWGVVPALIALVLAHFWLSALALRGAAGERLPLLQATMAQFTAATANRITGGGLGTVAVNSRYLCARGIPAGRAVTVAGALQIGGAIADLLLFAVVVPITLVTGGNLLPAGFGRHFGDQAGPIALAAAAAVIGAAAAGLLLRDRLRGPIAACADLLRRPADLLIMMAASAGTTLVMGVAFALSVLAVPGGTGPGRIATLVGIYMIAAAAGGVVPGPGGLGSTEAALVALLVAGGTGAASALSAVLLFRAVTHWAPVPVGLLTATAVARGERAPAVPEAHGSLVDGPEPGRPVVDQPVADQPGTPAADRPETGDAGTTGPKADRAWPQPVAA